VSDITKPEADSVLQRSTRRALRDILNVLLVSTERFGTPAAPLASEECALLPGVTKRSIRCDGPSGGTAPVFELIRFRSTRNAPTTGSKGSTTPLRPASSACALTSWK